jgi:UDP-N-acetylmuramate--alanine ligase
MHIYFSGIGGSGLEPLAHLALDCGFEVSGSDSESSPGVLRLKERVIQVSLSQSLEEIQALHTSKKIDWIVHTSALKADHPHLLFAQKEGIRITKRNELINEILKLKNLKLIAVAGTHGKTTTTGMLIWIFNQLKLPISYLVGSSLSFAPSGKFQLGSSYFVYECDEFDRNFLHFQPYLSLVTSLDYDHPDTYKTEKEYAESFVQFFSQSEHVISWSRVNEYLHQVFGRDNLSFEKMLHGKEIYFLSEEEANNQSYFVDNKIIKLAGQHNRRNALLAILAMIQYVISDGNKEVFEAINTFPGTGRRFEKLTNNLYSDYGHHPVEIAATLNLAREIIEPNQKIVLVYQPHQNVRQHEAEIQQGYTTCFAQADKVYWLPTYLSRETDLPILSPADLLQIVKTKLEDKKKESSEIKFNTNPKNIEVSNLDQDLKNQIEKHLTAGDLVICMGAGNIDAWFRENITL